ncbi:hypothetical protein BH10PSE3_BH10PSE3_32840 [soil metagenome]
MRSEPFVRRFPGEGWDPGQPEPLVGFIWAPAFAGEAAARWKSQRIQDRRRLRAFAGSKAARVERVREFRP